MTFSETHTRRFFPPTFSLLFLSFGDSVPGFPTTALLCYGIIKVGRDCVSSSVDPYRRRFSVPLVEAGLALPPRTACVQARRNTPHGTSEKRCRKGKRAQSIGKDLHSTHSNLPKDAEPHTVGRCVWRMGSPRGLPQ